MKLATLAWLALALGPVRARAEAASTHDASSPEASYFPDAFEAQRAQDQATSRELERALTLLPGVSAARVSVQRTHPALVPLDQPIPQTRLHVLLQRTNEAPQPSEVKALLQGFAGTEAMQPTIELVEARGLAPALPPPLTRFETNESPFRTLLAISLAANVLLATVLLFRGRARG
ncbi:MAG: hypothetical protein QM778_10135 [Myxococcales bacterium]